MSSISVDALEQFVLHGDAREVDAWWAEKGMGLTVSSEHDWFHPTLWPSNRRHCRNRCGEVIFVRLGEPKPKPCTGSAPHYTTDRDLARVIDDRVEEYGNVTVFCKHLFEMASDMPWSGECNPSDIWHVRRLPMRQVILAAARAMGLEL